MINSNKNILFTATVLALCVILFVHVFLFPLYAVNPNHIALKTFADFEKSLCLGSYIKQKKVWHKQQCPRYGVVTTMEGGRLGNQMWEYAAVWAVARRTGLEPYMPRCMQLKLEPIFDLLTVPTFEEISHCPIDMSKVVKSLNAWNYTYQSIVLPRYSVMPDLVLTWVQDITQEFTFKKKLINKSQSILRSIAKNRTQCVFVGVHVRRTDYINYLKRRYSMLPANSSFYFSAFKYYEKKYRNVLFIMASDDPAWCLKKFGRKSNVYLMSKHKSVNPSSLDLAILAACNHSIIDYGTFSMWGAILAGGETIFYNSMHPTNRISQILPNWHTLN